MSKKENKFKFISSDELTKKEIPEIEILESLQEVNVDIKEEKKEEKHKFHYSFEARIVTRIVIVLILFITACILIYKVVNHTTYAKLGYNEVSTSKYEVCTKESECLEENTTYNSNDINIIKTTFNYNIKYAKSIKYNLKYYISATITGYENEERKSIVYYKKNMLLDDIELSEINDNVKIHESVIFDFTKYREEIQNSNSQDAVCEIVFYVKEPDETRRISMVTLPLSKDSFGISKMDTSNNDKTINILVNLWDKYSISLALISTILIIISLIIIYRTTRLLLKVTNSKTTYQQELDSILNEYDNLIVVARDGYESKKEVEVIELDGFEELLKINKQTKKPIIYSRVNNVKSEFLIESDKLYKVVMKEADYK